MERKNLYRWLQKEKMKDQKELEQHKLKLINEIKKDGLKGILNKTQPIKISLWKRMKDLVLSWKN